VDLSIGKLSEVQRFIIKELPARPRDIAKAAGEKFGITRQAVNRHLRNLVELGVLKAIGETRNRRYIFPMLRRESAWLTITPQLEEDAVWREKVAPALIGVPEHVLDICRYGVTEIVNNAIDHSESAKVGIEVEYQASRISVRIIDQGIGIFRKIKEYCGLDDERLAILELSKGKLTTDPSRHTGEGIFFTSRMFDHFSILSGHLNVGCRRGGGDWLMEDRDHPVDGTSVDMEIGPLSTHTTKEIFDRYATSQDDYAFGRTRVLVALAKLSHGEKLVSRSQAKRVMARLERFKEVVLDFEGIEEIGPAFADEIFRVFWSDHPETHIRPINTTDEVLRMIRRAETATHTGSPSAGTSHP